VLRQHLQEGGREGGREGGVRSRRDDPLLNRGGKRRQRREEGRKGGREGGREGGRARTLTSWERAAVAGAWPRYCLYGGGRKGGREGGREGRE